MNVHVQVLVDEMTLVDTKSNREKIFPEQFPEKVILRVKRSPGDTFGTVWCWVREKVSWWSSKLVTFSIYSYAWKFYWLSVVKPTPRFSDVYGRSQFSSSLTNCVESWNPYPGLSTQEFRGCVFNNFVQPHRECSKVVEPQAKCRLLAFQNTSRKSVPKWFSIPLSQRLASKGEIFKQICCLLGEFE